MTQDELLDRAMRSFWRRGLLGTSVSDLVVDTGAQRSTLYRIHDGKQALFLAALERYNALRIGAVDPDASPPDQARQWMEAALGPYRGDEAPHGCLLISTAGEYAALDPVVQEQVSAHLDKLRLFFRAAAQSARPERSPDEIRDASAVLMGANTAVFLLARIRAPEAELRAILEAAWATAL